MRAYVFAPPDEMEHALDALNQLKTLEYLDLSDTALTDDGLARLAGLTELRNLSLSGTRISDAGLEQLKNMTFLEVLALNRLPITDVGLSRLQTLPRLKEVSVVGGKVTQAGVLALRGQRKVNVDSDFDTAIEAQLTNQAELVPGMAPPVEGRSKSSVQVKRASPMPTANPVALKPPTEVVAIKTEFENIEAQSNILRLLAISPSGEVVAMGNATFGDNIHLWDSGTGAPQQSVELGSGRGQALQLQFTSDERYLLVENAGTISKENGQWTPFPEGLSPDCCVLAPDGKSAVLGLSSGDKSEAKILRIVSIPELTVIGAYLEVFDGAVQALAYSPDGMTLAVAFRARNVHRLLLLDAKTGGERSQLGEFEADLFDNARIDTIVFSPDGMTMASHGTYGQDDHRIILWDLTTGKPRKTVNTRLWTMEFTDNGKKLAAIHDGLEFGDRSLRVFVYDTLSGELRSQSEFRPQGLADVICASRGILASGLDSGEVVLWDIQGNGVAVKFKAHSGPVQRIAFSPDGKFLATQGRENKLKVWSLDAMKPQPALPTGANVPSTKPTPKSAGPKSATNSLGMRFITIPAGEFQMGVPQNSPENTERSECPQHKVYISKPLTIGVHEVTVGQFRAFVIATGYATDAETEGAGSNGYDAVTKTLVQDNWPEFNWKNIGTPQSEDCPVTNVSWNDTKAFCVWLSGKEGNRYRLPTEAEWEYCCRAGASTRFPTGDEETSLKGLGNIGDAALLQKWPAATWTIKENDGYAFTAPVGKFKANAWGIYDMIGNVSEWCEDWHDPDYYAASPASDPVGPSHGEGRVVRGGSWFTEPSGQRPAIRVPGWPPTWRSMILGFRVVCD